MKKNHAAIVICMCSHNSVFGKIGRPKLFVLRYFHEQMKRVINVKTKYKGKL